jgi:hypothetical protein
LQTLAAAAAAAPPVAEAAVVAASGEGDNDDAMAVDGAMADSLPVALRDSLPENQRDAILRIDAAADLTEPQAASADYAGRKYVISDRAGSMRYRTSFQTLQFVFAECELNPAQVPQSTTLQVR